MSLRPDRPSPLEGERRGSTRLPRPLSPDGGWAVVAEDGAVAGPLGNVSVALRFRPWGDEGAVLRGGAENFICVSCLNRLSDVTPAATVAGPPATGVVPRGAGFVPAGIAGSAGGVSSMSMASPSVLGSSSANAW